jgi:hypothetical protein
MPVFPGESAPELDRVDAEEFEDIFIDDGELLDGVIDPHRARFEAKVPAEAGVGNGRDARRPMPREIDGHAVGFLVV